MGKCSYKKEFVNFGAKVHELKTRKISRSIFRLNTLVKKIISEKFSKNIFISGIHDKFIASIISLRSIKNLKIIVVERTDHTLKIYKSSYNFNNLIKNTVIYFLLKVFYKPLRLVKLLAKNDLQRWILIKPGTPPSFLGYEKIKKNKKKKFLNLLTVGRLSHEKGIYTMIKAINEIKEKNVIFSDINSG